MRVAVVGLRLAATVAERVELLDIAKPHVGLLVDPCAQAHFKCAMGQRIERAGRQSCLPGRIGARHKDHRLVVRHGDDGRREVDLDGHGGRAGAILLLIHSLSLARA